MAIFPYQTPHSREIWSFRSGRAGSSKDVVLRKTAPAVASAAQPWRFHNPMGGRARQGGVRPADSPRSRSYASCICIKDPEEWLMT